MHYNLKQNIRQEVINAIGNDYPDHSLFDKHFNDAISQVDDSGNVDAVDEVIKIMQGLLSEYAKTEGKTRFGKVGRFFALIGSKILPFAKIFINKKQK
jgi:hypothetical protein